MRTIVRHVGLVLGLMLGVHGEVAAQDIVSCTEQLKSRSPLSPKGGLQAKDLVELLDLGANEDEAAGNSSLALSPDGHSLAVQLRRADSAHNTYCTGLLVLDLGGDKLPRLIDQGATFPRMQGDFRGLADYPTGLALSAAPQWSMDGRSILFLKPQNGTIQIWQAQADGTGSVPLTHGENNVTAFALADDGHSIAFSDDQALRISRDAIDREGLQGFHFDDRFVPMANMRPFPQASESPRILRLRLGQNTIDQGGAEDRKLIADRAHHMRVAQTDGGEAWIATQSGIFPTQTTLWVRRQDSPAQKCEAQACSSLIQLWWSPDGAVRFMRREGWDKEATAIYEWDPRHSPAASKLFSTRDRLTSCLPDKGDLICLREGSTMPRYISHIALPEGDNRVVFDPNPGFQTILPSRIERLHWRNNIGLETFGDLVFPSHYIAGQRYPLIVVQYDSRGFLRGGTGDEYPIFLFASLGFAVLSIDRPAYVASLGSPGTVAEAESLGHQQHAERRSLYSAVREGVLNLVKWGIADPEHIGITGLSDGASTATFALINDDLFKAASISSCCRDAMSDISVGIKAAEYFHSVGYPPLTQRHDPFWRAISLADNAQHMTTPLLIQSADLEARGALPAFLSLRHYGQPVDLFVFPNEAHIKWQPAHRLAIYRRNIAWFQFWLGKGQPDYDEQEIQRWQAMRENY